MVKQLGSLILWVSRPKWNDAFRKLEVLERREKEKANSFFLLLSLSVFIAFLTVSLSFFLLLSHSVSISCFFLLHLLLPFSFHLQRERAAIHLLVLQERDGQKYKSKIFALEGSLTFKTLFCFKPIYCVQNNG